VPVGGVRQHPPGSPPAQTGPDKAEYAADRIASPFKEVQCSGATDGANASWRPAEGGWSSSRRMCSPPWPARTSGHVAWRMCAGCGWRASASRVSRWPHGWGMCIPRRCITLAGQPVGLGAGAPPTGRAGMPGAGPRGVDCGRHRLPQGRRGLSRGGPPVLGHAGQGGQLPGGGVGSAGGERGSAPVDWRLFLPESWDGDPSGARLPTFPTSSTTSPSGSSPWRCWTSCTPGGCLSCR
jgi:hypothetical protein